MNNGSNNLKTWQLKLHEIIFEADTKAGKIFDIILLFSIITSVIAVTLESVEIVQLKYGPLLYYIEWAFTILFTIEYIARILAVQRPKLYIFSFYGIIDLLAILPTYLSLIMAGTQALVVIRILRLLRVFRVLKLVRFLREAGVLFRAILASLPKIIVFIVTVVCIAIIMATCMYLIEGPENGFVSIPVSLYWTIVTMTTVGYGDIAPQTPMGKLLASILMIMGYGIIAVPTGIVTMHLSRSNQEDISRQACPTCSREGHDPDAEYCKFCGSAL